MTDRKRPLVIGTRGSDLALWQARAVAGRLRLPSEISIVRTSGDRFLDVPLQGRMDKGFFTKEIEEKLLIGEIDLAVHSLKDLPTDSHPDLCVSAYLERSWVSDLLLVNPEWHDRDKPVPLRSGCRVGATSLRRQALLRALAPDVKAAFLRGNVPTRIRKCREGDYGAVILARAGIERLGPKLAPLLVYELDPGIWLPAPGQGVIAIQARTGDEETLSVLRDIDHTETRRAAQIERGLLSKFEGGCHTAFGAWARTSGDIWEVVVGLELPEEGWGQTTFTGPFENCLSRDPKTLTVFQEPHLHKGRPLCRSLQ